MKKMLSYICCLLTAVIMSGAMAETMQLRGLGMVDADFGPLVTQFRCESQQKAEWLYSKLRKDLLYSAMKSPQAETMKIDGRELPIWQFANGGSGTLGIDGTTVVVLSGEDRAGLEKIVREEMAKRKLMFPSGAEHPKYLDYYDFNAFRFYTQAMDSTMNEGLDKHWPFVKKLGLGGMSVQSPSLSESTAPGVISFIKVDYEMDDAKRHDGFVVLGPSMGGQLPLWMYNRNPGKTAKVQNSTLFSGWSHGTHAATFEADSPWQPEESPILAMQKLVMEHYKDHPSLGGWHMNRGQPVSDMIGILMDGCLWDASPGVAASMREWLRSRYTLGQLGRRWFNDEKHYKSWDEVLPVQLMDLVGGSYEDNRMLLSDKVWEWRKATKTEQGKQPDSTNRTPWVKVEMPPSQRAAFVDSGSGYYRLHFSAPEYLKKRADRKLYLKAALYQYDNNKLNVWVNQKQLVTQPHYSSGVKQVGIEIPAGMLSADRENEIVIQTPDGRSDGRLHGPISLSEHPAENYPYAASTVNAKYVDSLEFQLFAILRRIEEMIRYGRQIDPDRPFVISCGWWPSLARLAPMASRYGVGTQYTACEGFYNAQYPRLAADYGFYFSAEPSGAVLNAELLDRMLGLMLYEGSSSFDMFHNAEQYIRFDRETGALTKRAPMLKLVGKYLPEKPKMAIFWTSSPLASETQFLWNLGRGELQSAHFSAAYISEEGLAEGHGKSYPLLIDVGNDILSENAIVELRRYVEAGGTYVVLPPTGRHSDLKKDAQPIAALSGFRVIASGMQGRIRFEDDPVLFRNWKGQEFNGNGSAFDWKGVPVASRSGVELKPVAADAQIVARWESGSVALGVRKVGKGKVITIGTTFWRNGRDVNGKWLPEARNDIFAQFMRELGAEKTADADSEKIWVCNAITKNGLEDWMLATNIAETAPFDIKTDLYYQLDFAPKEIIDLTSGKPVEFKNDGKNRITLAGIQFTKYQTRIFAAARPQPLAVTVKDWWQEKTTYWHAAPQEKLPMPKAMSKETIVIENWKFAADSTGSISGNDAWQQRDYIDSAWKNMPSGSWKLLDPQLDKYEGVGLYRTEFQLPDNWQGRTVTLNFKEPVACDRAEFFINGVAVTRYDINRYYRELNGTLVFDITRQIQRTGKNVLAVKVEGGKGLSGICNPVWIAAEIDLQPSINLNGKWECVKKNLVSFQTVELPGAAFGRYLCRDFEVPAEWAGKAIYVRVETNGAWCGAIMINGRAKGKDYSFCPLDSMTELNVSEFIKPGQKNTIELWHRYTIPVNWRGLPWNWPSEAMLTVNNVVIGCKTEDKK